MGGTALGFEAKRLSKSEYDAMYLKVHSELCALQGIPTKNQALYAHDMEYTRDSFCVSLIPSYRQKADFGDMDVLLHSEPEIYERIIDHTGSVFKDWSGDIACNGDVTSVGIRVDGGVAQLDIIYTGTDFAKHNAAYAYFAYNDLGNLMGRIANRMGFKFGHTGLSYRLHDPATGYFYGEYEFDMTPDEVMEFIGFNYSRWEEGFDTLEDVFEFVASSPYFDPGIYLLDNLNAVSRIRDKKRKTYMTFLDWLERRGYQESDLRLAELEKTRFKDYMFRSKMMSDPEFAKWVTDAQFYHAEAQHAKTFWNGSNVMDWTGLRGKELGDFLGDIQTFVEGDSVLTFNEWVVMMQGNVRTFVKDFFKQWKEDKNVTSRSVT